MSEEAKSASVGQTPAAPQTTTPVVPTNTPGAPTIDSPPSGTPAEAPQQPQTPGGTALTKGAEGDKPAESKPEAAGEFTPKLPEGFDANDGVLKHIEEIAKADGLKGEVAQKLVDLYVQQQQQAVKQAEERWTSQNKEWMDGAKADKEYGGEKFDANLTVARKAIAKFGTPELKQLLDTTGLGNHPELIRFVYRVGKGFADDSVAGTTGAGAGEVSGEEAKLRAMYPKMFQEN